MICKHLAWEQYYGCCWTGAALPPWISLRCIAADEQKKYQSTCSLCKLGMLNMVAAVSMDAVAKAGCKSLLCTPACWHISVVLGGILEPTLLDDLLQSSCRLQVLVLGYQLLPFCFTSLQVEGLLALLHRCTLFCLQAAPHNLSLSHKDLRVQQS